MYGIKSIGGSQPSVKLNQLFPSKFSRTTTTTRPYHLISALETLHSMSCSKVASFGEGFLIFEAMYHPSHQQDLQSIVFENHFKKTQTNMYYFVQIENATVFTNFKHCELFDVTKQRGRKEEETENGHLPKNRNWLLRSRSTFQFAPATNFALEIDSQHLSKQKGIHSETQQCLGGINIEWAERKFGKLRRPSFERKKTVEKSE